MQANTKVGICCGKDLASVTEPLAASASVMPAERLPPPMAHRHAVRAASPRNFRSEPPTGSALSPRFYGGSTWTPTKPRSPRSPSGGRAPKSSMASQRNGASNARGGLSYKDWSNPDVVFDQIDTDRSETLTLKELRVFFKSSPMMDGQHLEALFATLDEDGSGEVSREEWRRGFFRTGFASNEGSGQSRTQCP